MIFENAEVMEEKIEEIKKMSTYIMDRYIHGHYDAMEKNV